MFKNAIVRPPSPSMINGLTSSDLGKPDYKTALHQHSEYIKTLEMLGLKLKKLDENEDCPDSVFIEDVALCTTEAAIITRPGAISRRAEITGMKEILSEYYKNIYQIAEPGTLEAGDVMMAGRSFYIGISSRTNNEGADQLIKILKQLNMTGIKVPLKKTLHLKSGLSYLENNNLLISGEFINLSKFAGFNQIVVDKDETYAANSLWINGKVLVPGGYPKTKEKIEKAGYETIILDLSEFCKIDGGLSCLSLRF